MTFETVLVAILVAFGFIGVQGLQVQVKPFIKVPPRAAVHAPAPHYVCPAHIAAALRAGSRLDPAVFCQKTK